MPGVNLSHSHDQMNICQHMRASESAEMLLMQAAMRSCPQASQLAASGAECGVGLKVLGLNREFDKELQEIKTSQ